MTDRFRIEYRPSVEKDLRSINEQYRNLIFERIERLSLVPVGKGCVKIDARGK
jgi:mRNA-degrading endonuclease RelE of RelBE toxin-antitoxin system